MKLMTWITKATPRILGYENGQKHMKTQPLTCSDKRNWCKSITKRYSYASKRCSEFGKRYSDFHFPNTVTYIKQLALQMGHPALDLVHY